MINRRRIIDNDQRFSSKWWLAGSIASANCTLALQAVNAPSYWKSKINLANPGLYDAYEGVAPKWDRNNGWHFTAADASYLLTGLLINRNINDQALIVRFSGHPVSSSYIALAGSWNGSGTEKGRFWVAPEWGTNKVDFANGGELNLAATGGYTSGVMAASGTDAYYNGSDVGNIAAGNIGATDDFRIGQVHGLEVNGTITAYIQAIAVYNTTISPAQILAVTNAMNAL